ncbi:UvrD-helicase domain-containing protein [Photobacterium phosphoreum]|uniref:UvrD-helicase domain-containing protein n=1 Tax=Photobacterium phosphoreum TaxID=659 RepID=UPI0024B80C61|nr:UvrD-helicase domain-containing protein [Photobacterium phosphoreum]
MKIKITEEQLEITKDNSDFLIVSAGPGSGKTETLSKYIPERAMELTLGKKIIVCSYTVKSTNEIKTRTLRNNGEDGKALSESVIFLTFDSFLMNYF